VRHCTDSLLPVQTYYQTLVDLRSMQSSVLLCISTLLDGANQ